MTGHRNDLQGLRAIAVLLVVLSHARVPGFSGGFVGVDVFFVLSGYLITGLLIRGAADGLGSIGEFYKRRARRILPAATLTIVTTVVTAYELLNYVRARQVLTDSIWAAFFAANIHFARVGTDYFASAAPPSALQHFWTLAVEEQFYIVWPALLLVTLTLVIRHRHIRSSVRRIPLRMPMLLAVAAAITVASLALSIAQHGSTSSYFSTFSRAWELGLGATLAIVSAQRPLKVPGWVAWIGLAMIVAAGVAYSSSTPFPGYAALLPTVGTVLVIAAGLPVLAVAPLRYVGDRSYTLYLWHWPFLILAEEHAGHRLSVGANLLLVAASFALSIVTYRFYEDPIRRHEWSGAASAFAFVASAAVVVFIAVGLTSKIDAKTFAAQQQSAVVAAAPAGPSNADLTAQLAAIAAGEKNASLPSVQTSAALAAANGRIPASLTPAVSALSPGEYGVPSNCIASASARSSSVCHLGSGSKTLLVVGDSHAQMWMPAITQLGYTVVPLIKQACLPNQWLNGGQCGQWFHWMLAQAKTLRADVAVIGGDYGRATPAEQISAVGGIAALASALRKSVARVVVVSDTPGENSSPVDCLLASGATMRSCSNQLSDAQASQQASTDGELASLPGVGYIDTIGWFCSNNVCPMVIGHTVAFADTGHITVKYSSALAPVFRAALDQAIK